jgi:hypothetical protein
MPKLGLLLLLGYYCGAAVAAEATTLTVPRYRVFEAEISNTKTRAANQFRDVTLNATFISPSNVTLPFWGFYDGADTWRLRYMPHVVGTWRFTWKFSDGRCPPPIQWESNAMLGTP